MKTIICKLSACKFIKKEMQVIRYTTDNLDISDDSNKDDTDTVSFLMQQFIYSCF